MPNSKMVVAWNDLGRAVRKQGIKGKVKHHNIGVLCIRSSYLSEEDIPGSSLNERDPKRLKNSELQFWLKCRGDSCKGLITKAQLCKR